MNAGCWLRHTNSVEAPLATAGAALALSPLLEVPQHWTGLAGTHGNI